MLRAASAPRHSDLSFPFLSCPFLSVPSTLAPTLFVVRLTLAASTAKAPTDLHCETGHPGTRDIQATCMRIVGSGWCVSRRTNWLIGVVVLFVVVGVVGFVA